jgi:hypothetical protein
VIIYPKGAMTLRIAYISTEYPPLVYGGLGVYVDNISLELSGLGQRISIFTWGDDLTQNHENRGDIEIFREKPVSIKDGLEIFLSPQSLAWGSGLGFLMDLFSFNQLCGPILRRKDLLTFVSLMIGLACRVPWPLNAMESQ